MQPAPLIKVLLVDHRVLVRSGIASLLTAYPDFRVDQARTGEDALKASELDPADVLVTEIDLPGAIGTMDLLRVMRARWPQTHPIVLTSSIEPNHVRAVLREGAIGYLLKTISVDELAQAIRGAVHGIPTLSAEVTQVLLQQTNSPADLVRSLTTREQQVLGLMARGWNNQRIADELNITLSTVQFHVSNVLDKLNVENRTAAAALALRHSPEVTRAWTQGNA